MATTAHSIRSYLDSLSQLPGSILYRSDLNWKGLPPGEAGQYLALDDDQMPAWTYLRDFQPALYQYNGTTTYLERTNLNVSNTKINAAIRFAMNPTGDPRNLMNINIGGARWLNIALAAAGTVFIDQRNNANASVLRLMTGDTFDDGNLHYLWLQYDPSTAATEFLIDAQPADDPAWPFRIQTTGTLPGSGSAVIHIGNEPGLPRIFPGLIGATAFKQGVTLNWQDFMRDDGWPIPVDHTTWATFFGQPPVWHESNDLRFNRGSAGSFTAFGPPSLADPLEWN